MQKVPLQTFPYKMPPMPFPISIILLSLLLTSSLSLPNYKLPKTRASLITLSNADLGSLQSSPDYTSNINKYKYKHNAPSPSSSTLSLRGGQQYPDDVGGGDEYNQGGYYNSEPSSYPPDVSDQYGYGPDGGMYGSDQSGYGVDGGYQQGVGVKGKVPLITAVSKVRPT